MRIITLLSMLAAGCSAGTDHRATILPPDFRLDGRGATELSTEWWQWAQSIPAEISPIRDTNGSRCAVGQNGDVWFLAGGYGSSKISRVCTIPYGKYIFFPAVNMAYWPRAENSNYTCEEAKRNAAVNNDSALGLFVEIDGIEVESPKAYRARTELCFDMYERVPLQYRPYRAYPSASDGYWYLLEPLEKGTHQIRFGGQYNNRDSDFGQMVQDIEYLVHVN